MPRDYSIKIERAKPGEDKKSNVKTVRLTDDQLEALMKTSEKFRFSESALIRVGTLKLLDEVATGKFSIEDLAEYAKTT